MKKRKKSCLKKNGLPKTAKRVRFAESLVEKAPSLYQNLRTVSKQPLRPMFNIPKTGRQTTLWGESWPSTKKSTDEPEEEEEEEEEYEMAWVWFCDECDRTIPDDAVRYECEICPREYCRCGACYRAGVVSGDRPHAHPLVATTRPFRVTSPAFVR